MDDVTRFEDRFEERIRAFARTGGQLVDSRAVARAAAVGYPKRAARIRSRVNDFPMCEVDQWPETSCAKS